MLFVYFSYCFYPLAKMQSGARIPLWLMGLDPGLGLS